LLQGGSKPEGQPFSMLLMVRFRLRRLLAFSIVDDIGEGKRLFCEERKGQGGYVPALP
jgi:hypothetical protein